MCGKGSQGTVSVALCPECTTGVVLTLSIVGDDGCMDEGCKDEQTCDEVSYSIEEHLSSGDCM
jgi:hypothetical protein